ncbi:hypothetical protein AB0O91_21075 [Kitasatospora sp. NPDC089797]|uniref:hypothetical protein n=1 Tax=Kitasatospora sp. NPDC089797 TaxID=3155298 RepID=UPI0034400FAB
MPWRGAEYKGEFPSLGWTVGEWIEELCVIPDGDRAGEPYRLTDEMWEFLAHYYRLKPEAQAGQRAPAFAYRRAQLVRPQKWGKGPFSASLICAEAVGPVLFDGWDAEGEPVGRPWPTPLIQIAANSEDQTANVYAALQPMIELGPLADLIPDTGDTRINLPGGGRIDPVTSRARTRLGQRVTFVVQDETGLWTVASGMVAVAETQRRGLAGMGGRSIETTNSWDPSEDSVAQRTYESRVRDIYRDHRLADARLDYRLKRDRKKIHRAVYGDSAKKPGGWVDLDAIEAEAAELAERDLAQAERFFGNRVVSGTGTWLERPVWDTLAEPRPTPPPGTRIVLGFDGSDLDDWSAFRAETLDGYQWTPTYSSLRLPTIWDPREWGGQVPRLEVAAALDELMRTFDVVRLYCDPPYWETEIDEWADRYGDRVVRWATYRIAQMHAAAERLLTDVTKGGTGFRHDGCQATSAHIGNARRAARPGDRYVLRKASTAQKIDVAVVSILVHEAAGDAVAAGLARTDPESTVVVMR